jgi:valyl-tRNA synthetase
MGLGADTILDPNDLERSFAPGRNFVTKLWNIGRYLLTNVGDSPVPSLDTIPPNRLTRADRWILGRLNDAIAACDTALGPARPAGDTWSDGERLAGLRLNEYTEAARGFAWGALADWYVESVKARLATDGPDRDVARAVLVHAFDQGLRLLQPIVPFVTDDIWRRLPGRHDEALPVASWPVVRAVPGDAAEFELVINAVDAIRRLRADNGITPGKTVVCVMVPAAAAAATCRDEAELIGRLSRTSVTIAEAPPEGAAAHAVLPDGTQVVMPLAGIVDLEKECTRLKSELAGLEKQLGGLRARLQNESFLSRARPDVVAAERQKEGEWSARRDLLADKVRALCGG